jgi:predicted MFS family arabinose efflux permease
MLDITLFRQPAFLGVSLATFAIAAGMFAMFPYLSIYLQDELGTSPLGAGLRFLPLTAFVFAVPLVMRRFGERVQARVVSGAGLALVGVALIWMHGLSTDSHWTALLGGFILAGLGIGLANPVLAATALRVVDPGRAGMASGINNSFRLGGVAIGVAALGAVLEHRVGTTLASSAHVHSRQLAAAISSSGQRATAHTPALAHTAATAFVNGLNAVFLVGSALVFAGAIAAAALIRAPAAAPVPVPERAEPAVSSSGRGA